MQETYLTSQHVKRGGDNNFTMESYVHSNKQMRMTQHTYKPRIANKTQPSAQYRLSIDMFMYMYTGMSVSSVLNILNAILDFLWHAILLLEEK